MQLLGSSWPLGNCTETVVWPLRPLLFCRSSVVFLHIDAYVACKKVTSQFLSKSVQRIPKQNFGKSCLWSNIATRKYNYCVTILLLIDSTELLCTWSKFKLTAHNRYEVKEAMNVMCPNTIPVARYPVPAVSAIQTSQHRMTRLCDRSGSKNTPSSLGLNLAD